MPAIDAMNVVPAVGTGGLLSGNAQDVPVRLSTVSRQLDIPESSPPAPP